MILRLWETGGKIRGETIYVPSKFEVLTNLISKKDHDPMDGRGQSGGATNWQSWGEQYTNTKAPFGIASSSWFLGRIRRAVSNAA
jgi:hypothetical protein